MSNPPWSWPGSTITRVVDGDTLVARVTRDLGFHGVVIFDQRLRLNRVNSPPANTDAGKSATAALDALLPVTITVLIETTKPYKYGDEWMAEITLPDGRNVSDELVKQGVAVYWDGSGPRPGG